MQLHQTQGILSEFFPFLFFNLKIISIHFIIKSDEEVYACVTVHIRLWLSPEERKKMRQQRKLHRFGVRKLEEIRDKFILDCSYFGHCR